MKAAFDIWGRIVVITGIAIVSSFWDSSAQMKIFDGSPKKVVVLNQWSWGLGGGFKDAFAAGYGFTNLRCSSPEYNDMPINDTLGVKKGSWLQNVDYSSEPLPVIMVVYGGGTRVNGPQDTANINLGVRKIQKLTEELKKRGADMVFVTTKHYRWGRAKTPTFYNEMNDTLIINAYNRLTGEHLGVNVMTPTRLGYPYTLVSDLEHPTSYLSRLYASNWLAAMLRQDGRPVPEKLWTDNETSRLNEQKKRSQLKITVQDPSTLAQLKIGQQVKLQVEVTQADDYSDTIRIVVMAFRNTCAFAYLVHMQKLTGAQTTVTFTIPDSSDLVIYNPTAGKKLPLVADSAKIMGMIDFTNYRSFSSCYQMGTSFQLLNRDGTPAKPSVRIAQPSVQRVYQQNPDIAGPMILNLMGRDLSLHRTKTQARTLSIRPCERIIIR